MGLRPGGRRGEPLRPVLREIDAATGHVTRDLRWRSRGVSADDHELTVGWRDGTTLWQPTRSELLEVDLEAWRVRSSWSHRLLYDVHSAAPRPGGGHVITATGHDSVLEVDGGRVVAHRWLREGRFSDVFGAATDFREVEIARHKPHTHHPNHAFYLDGDLWVTLLQQRECRCLTRPGSIPIPEGPPHDGVLREGVLWFTAVTGHLVGVDPRTQARVLTLDLGALEGERGWTGWCRGVDVVGTRAWVGMTVLRSSAHREVLRRLVRGRDGVSHPTRVLEVDLDGPRVRAVHPVGNRAGGTLYAVHAVGDIG